jgi:hypothetical protein
VPVKSEIRIPKQIQTPNARKPNPVTRLRALDLLPLGKFELVSDFGIGASSFECRLKATRHRRASLLDGKFARALAGCPSPEIRMWSSERMLEGAGCGKAAEQGAKFPG